MYLQNFYTVDGWNTLYNILSIAYLLSLLIIALLRHKMMLKTIEKASVCYVVLFFLLVAFRPIGIDGFEDTPMYMQWFKQASESHRFSLNNDIGYDILNFLMAQVFSVRVYFIFLALIGGVLVYQIFVHINKTYVWIMIGVYCVMSFHFIFHSVLIRQNLAFLLFLYAIVEKNIKFKVVFFALSILFHKSMFIPLSIYTVVSLFNIKPQYYFIVWVGAVIISLWCGDLIINTIRTLNIETFLDHRIKYIYENDPNSGYYSEKKWPWKTLFASFLISIFGLFISRTLKDRQYDTLISIFIASNSIWIIFMRANFHYRIAYLSLFLIPLILLFPFKKSCTN